MPSLASRWGLKTPTSLKPPVKRKQCAKPGQRVQARSNQLANRWGLPQPSQPSPAASFIQQQAQAVPATQTSVSGSLGGGRLGGDSWVGRRVRGSPCGKTFSAECQASLCALQVAVLIFAFNFFSCHVRSRVFMWGFE